MSIPSQAALTHLRAIKPQDGWSVQVQTMSQGMKLLRRNVALSDNGFLDIHYDTATKYVVGILTKPENGKSQAQVLVNESGKPTRERKLLLVSYDPSSSANVSLTHARSVAASNTIRRTETSSSNNNNNSTSNQTPTISEEQNMELVKYAAMFVGGSIVFRAFASLFVVYAVALPLLYLYAMSTCPSQVSFDAKKELKRVLRGHHLPESHPDKPRGFFEGLAARVAASVTTELATLPGYEVSMLPLAGAAIVTTVTVPTASMEYYWVGALDKWYYITSRELPNSRYD
jgi:hypothetical protein